ncbi:MAG: XylR N-terminal domain-containing protein [Ardenticatenaceae bacterium]|nr:XylR N-terminal domain-containing protein [Ardenticatenaceae bacterium]
MTSNDNPILTELTYDPRQGGLFYKDVRYLLIRPETLRDFQKAVEEAVGHERAGELLATGGHTGGLLSSKKYKEVFGLSDREAVEFMCRMGGQIGWGAMRLVELDATAGRLVVEVESSPFAAAYGPSDHGVCHFVRGVMAGMAEGLFGHPVHSVETHCLAMGHEQCRIVVGQNDLLSG